MFKRLLSIILAATMLLTFPVFAEELEAEVIEEQAAAIVDSGNVAFLKALELIGEDVLGTHPLKRGTFAKMFCTIARFDISVPAISKVAFTDVSTNDSSPIGAVAAMGIMNGVGGGLFQPDNNVTYIQAIKSMVTFLGYSQNAEAKGGFPYGYYMQATELGLVKNAPTNMNVEITVEKAAELFKLALNVDFRAPYEYKDQTLYYEISKNLTYLEYYRNIIRARGIVEANFNTDLTGAGLVDRQQIRVNGQVYKFDYKKFDASEFIGQQIDAYYANDTKDLYYVEAADTTVVVMDDDEIYGLNGDKIEYYNSNDKKKSYKIHSTTQVVYNGVLLTNYTEADINPFVGSALDGSVKLIDNNGDNVFDVVLVDAYETYLVQKVVNEVIFTKYRNGAAIDLTDYNVNESKIICNIADEALQLGAIAEGNILSVSKGKDGRYTKIVVTNDSFIGVVDAKKEFGGKVYLTISGREFETSNSIALNPEFEKFKLGQKVEVFFNKDALISDINYSEHNEMSVGYLVDHAEGTDFDPTYYLRIFTSQGDWVIYQLADKVTINARAEEEESEVYEDKAISASAFLDEAGVDAEGAIKRQPILYSFNDKGQINAVYLQKTTNTTDPLFMFEGFDGVSSIPAYRSTPKSFGGKLLVTSTTVVFSVPSDENRDNEDDYRIRNVGSYLMSNGSTNKFEAYGTKDRPVATIVVYKGYATTPSFTTSTYSMVVSNIDHYINEKDEEVYKLTGYSGSNFLEYEDDGDMLHIGPDGTLPEPGDVIIVQTDPNTNKINHTRFFFDASTKKLYSGTDSETALTDNVTSTTFTSSPRFAYGKVTYFDDEIMTVETYNERGVVTTSFNYPLSGFRISHVSKQGKDLVVTTGKSSQIIGEAQAIGKGSTVVVHTYSGYNRHIVVYED